LAALVAQDSLTETLQDSQVVQADTPAAVELAQLQQTILAQVAAPTSRRQHRQSQLQTVYTIPPVRLTAQQSQT
jgi:hypothetical protein